LKNIKKESSALQVIWKMPNIGWIDFNTDRIVKKAFLVILLLEAFSRSCQ